MKCSNCGKEIYSDQMVCGFCGSRNVNKYNLDLKVGNYGSSISGNNVDSDFDPTVGFDDGVIKTPNRTMDLYNDSNKKKKNNTVAALIFIGFIAIVGFAVWFVFKNRETQHEKILKKYFDAYSSFDTETISELWIPRMMEKRNDEGDTLLEAYGKAFEETQKGGVKIKFDVKLKVAGKVDKNQVEKIKAKEADYFGSDDIKISDLKFVKVKGKMKMIEGDKTYSRDYNKKYIVGKYNGEYKIYRIVD